MRELVHGHGYATKSDYEAAGERWHWLILKNEPRYPGLFVLRLVPADLDSPNQLGRVVKTSPTLADLHSFIPEGYENTGVPVGRDMLEVWV